MGRLSPRTEEDLKEIAKGIHAGHIFTSNQVPEDMLTSVFMLVGLGAFADWTEEELKDIGLLYEDMSQRGPWAVNGYPQFFSLKVLSKADAAKVFEYVERIMKAMESI